LLTFSNIECRLAQHEADELETRIAGMRNNRKNRGKRGLQAFVLAFFSGDFRLQESGKGLELGRKQERNIKHAGALGKTLGMRFFSVKE